VFEVFGTHSNNRSHLGVDMPRAIARSGLLTLALAILTSLVLMSPTVASAASWGTKCEATTENEETEPPTIEPLPCLEAEAASAITETTATLHGVINPHGLHTTALFEYVANETFEEAEFNSPEEPPINFTSEVKVSGSTNLSEAIPVSGLTPGTTYHVRMASGEFVENKAEEFECLPRCETSENEITFTTLAPAIPPTVTTGAAESVSFNTATLTGSVNPHGRATTYHFDYGNTTSYGINTSTVSAGEGTAAVPVSSGLAGLVPGVTYHYRLVATNAAGSSFGSDATFVAARYVQLFGIGDFNGDGDTDVMGAEPNGHVYLYAGNGKGAFAGTGAGVLIGEEFYPRFATVFAGGDFNGDGHADMMAEESNGDLYLYPGNGTGGFGNGGHAILIGEGFNRYVSVFSVGDFNGDKHPDLMGLERPGGLLYLYPGNGKGAFGNGGHGILVGEGF
jgi:hypothetical protein